jgi:hypothetical protein
MPNGVAPLRSCIERQAASDTLARPLWRLVSIGRVPPTRSGRVLEADVFYPEPDIGSIGWMCKACVYCLITAVLIARP